MGLFGKFRDWFAVQGRLARAQSLLLALDEKSHAANIDRAIVIYEEALTLATLHRFDFAPEEICLHLGIAYAVRINGDPDENHARAFHLLQRAVAPEDFPSLQSHVANRLFQRSESLARQAQHNSRPDKAIKPLEKAIGYGRLAAKLYENVNLTREWGRMQMMLALHYLTLDEMRLLAGATSREYERPAIHHGEQARSVFLNIPDARELRAVNLILGLLYYVRGEGYSNENSERAAQFLETLSHDPHFTGFNSFLTASVHSLLAEEQSRRTDITYGEKLEKTTEHIGRLLEADLSDTPRAARKLIVERIFKTMIYHGGFLRGFENDFNSERLDSFNQTMLDAMPRIEQGVGGNLSTLFRAQAAIFKHLDEVPDHLSDAELEEFAGYCLKHQLPASIRLARQKNPDFLKSIESLLTETLDRELRELDASPHTLTPFEQADKHLSISALCVGLINFTTDTEERRYREAALAHFKEAFDFIWRHPHIYLPADCAMTFGLELLFRGQFWAEAEAVFRPALESQEQQYRLAVTETARQFVLKETGYAMFSLLLPYAYVLARQGKAVEAVEMLETWRGRQLAENLQTSTETLDLANPVDRQSYLEIANEIKSLLKQSRLAVGGDSYNAGRRLETSRAQLEAVVSRVRAYSPDFLSAPAYTEIQKAASVGKPIIYLLATEHGSLALAVPPEGAPSCIFIDGFTQGSLLSLLLDHETGIKLGDKHFPIEKKLSAEIIPEVGRHFTIVLIDYLRQQAATGAYLIPCGSLSALPLHTAMDTANGCLIDHFDIHFIPTARALAASWRSLQRSRPEVNRLLAVGNPGNDLVFTAAEAESLASIFAAPHVARTLLREAATLDNLKDSLAGVTHLHFACHAEFDSEKPLDSALLLANGQRLTLRRVLSDMALAAGAQARLVVLSACQTALSEYMLLPDEAHGLPAGFLQTGVPGVVGTLWPVYDLSTALVMVRFYSNLLQRNLSPPAALREAQTWLRDATVIDLFDFCRNFPSLSAHSARFRIRDARYIEGVTPRSGERPYQDSYYWAGFILVGL